MRKLIWIVPVLLVLGAAAAPNAKADSISFFGGTTPPSTASVSISGTDAITLGSITDDGYTFTFSSALQASSHPYTDSYSWLFDNYSAFGFEDLLIEDDTTGSTVYDEPGYVGNGFGTESGTASVSGTVATAPEPGTLALLPLGLVALFLMRKRIARGALQSA